MIKIGDHDHIRRQIILYSFNAAAARYFLPAALHTRRRRHSTLLIYWAVVVTLSPFLGIADSALLLSKLVPWQQHKMKMMKSINITKSIKKRGSFFKRANHDDCWRRILSRDEGPLSSGATFAVVFESCSFHRLPSSPKRQPTNNSCNVAQLFHRTDGRSRVLCVCVCVAGRAIGATNSPCSSSSSRSTF